MSEDQTVATETVSEETTQEATTDSTDVGALIAESNYQETETAALLESVPEDEREALSKLDFETLKYVTSKINNAKANAPEVVGVSRQPEKSIGDWTKMSADDLRDNWENIVKSAEAKMKK